ITSTPGAPCSAASRRGRSSSAPASRTRSSATDGLKVSVRRTVLVREAAVGVGAHHIYVGADGDVVRCARTHFEIDRHRARSVDHVMTVAGVLGKGGAIAGAQYGFATVLDQRQLTLEH